MRKLLVPTDGSDLSLRAVDLAIERTAVYRDPVEIHLVNVQPAFSSDVSNHIADAEIKRYHHDEGIRELAEARARLDREAVQYRYHIGVGDPGHVIARFARELGCIEIIMSTRGAGGIAAVLGSVALRVVQLAECPVLLIK